MKMNEELANKVFDILANEGNHAKSYIDYRRAEFVHNMTTGEGLNEHWYPTESGSSIKVYFSWFRYAEFKLYAQTINPVHEKNLVENANRELSALAATVAPANA